MVSPSWCTWGYLTCPQITNWMLGIVFNEDKQKGLRINPMSLYINNMGDTGIEPVTSGM